MQSAQMLTHVYQISHEHVFFLWPSVLKRPQILHVYDMSSTCIYFDNCLS